MVEGEEGKLTASEKKFMKDAKRYLRGAMEQGKVKGQVPLGASVDLIVGLPPEEELGGTEGSVRAMKVEGARGRVRNPIYEVKISKSSIGLSDIIRHEGEHVFLGHPERPRSSGWALRVGDYLSFLERELETDFSMRRATGTLDKLPEDIALDAFLGVKDFGYLPEDAWEEVVGVSRHLGIPYRYINKSKEVFEEKYGYSL